MITSEHPSTVVLPPMAPPYPSILGFLTARFPAIGAEVWEARIHSGKVTTETGAPVSLDTAYEPLKKLHYFREVEKETRIPFAEKIVFCNDDLLVACKPHFLPVTPGGPYVNECLLNRLKKRTGNPALSPINRIDRETAGLVLFSMNKNTRGCYQEMFMKGEVTKTYDAVATWHMDQEEDGWVVENRIVKGDPWFRMKTVPGRPNAVSKISLVRSKGNKALFELQPVTGKSISCGCTSAVLDFPSSMTGIILTFCPNKTKGLKIRFSFLPEKFNSGIRCQPCL